MAGQGSFAAEAATNPAAAPRTDAEPPVALAAAEPPARPRWSASGAAEEGGYRLSLSRGSLDVGLRFESRVASPRQLDGRVDSAAPPGATLPALSFGLHTVSAGPASSGSLAERALGSTTSVPYVSKVGIEWKPAQPRVFFHQGLGVRLDSDDRLVMRLKKGSLGIYMNRSF